MSRSRINRLTLFVAPDAVVGLARRRDWLRSEPVGRPVVVAYSVAPELTEAIAECVRASLAQSAASAGEIDVIVSHGFVEFALLPQQSNGWRRTNRNHDEMAQASFARLYGQHDRLIASVEFDARNMAIASALRVSWMEAVKQALKRHAPLWRLADVKPWVSALYPRVVSSLSAASWCVWLEPGTALVMGQTDGRIVHWQSMPTDDLDDIASSLRRIEMRRALEPNMSGRQIHVAYVALGSSDVASFRTPNNRNDGVAFRELAWTQNDKTKTHAHWSLPLMETLL